MDGKLNKQNYDHTHFHPPLLKKKQQQKKRTLELLEVHFVLTFFLFSFLYVSMGSGVSRKWPSSSNTHTFAICSGSRFFHFVLQPHISFWSHSWSFSAWCQMSCPLCLCGWCSIINTEENEHVKRMHCRSLSFPLLFSICLFFLFLHQASLSVCLSQIVCPHLHLHFCSLSCGPPHISVHPPSPIILILL